MQIRRMKVNPYCYQSNQVTVDNPPRNSLGLPVGHLQAHCATGVHRLAKWSIKPRHQLLEQPQIQMRLQLQQQLTSRQLM